MKKTKKNKKSNSIWSVYYQPTGATWYFKDKKKAVKTVEALDEYDRVEEALDEYDRVEFEHRPREVRGDQARRGFSNVDLNEIVLEKDVITEPD